MAPHGAILKEAVDIVKRGFVREHVYDVIMPAFEIPKKAI